MLYDQNQIGIHKKSYSWMGGKPRIITFVITEHCQLRCKHCYVNDTDNLRVMDYRIAEQSIDYVLEERDIFNDRSVIYNFIGGEPFLEIDLIDRISDYIKQKMFKLDHPWFSNYTFRFSTNGILYDNSRVQRYIKKNRTNVNIEIAIEGTKEKHDLQRTYSDGNGSYDEIVKNIPLWLHQFSINSAKITITCDTMHLLKDSVIHLWSLGIKDVAIYYVFDDMWKAGDEKILETQLTELADEIIKKKLYKEFNCTFFTEHAGKTQPVSEYNKNQSDCGKKKLVIDPAGNFYACNHFLSYVSMTGKNERIIGNYKNGLDFNKLRPFFLFDDFILKPRKCIDCPVAMGCPLCPGTNYNEADTETIYQKAVSMCKIHKTRCRVNTYYWHRLYKDKT